ncbi:Beta-hexosaminidase [Aphelenchoides fujianensis]|nr:Beta-hexosaminidase [Aphelenchoides fujianensis]
MDCTVVVVTLLFLVAVGRANAEIHRDEKGVVFEFPPPLSKVDYGRENRTVRRGSISIVFQGLRDVDCDILEFAKRTYQKEWFFPNRPPSPTAGGMKLIVKTDGPCPPKDSYPPADMNEEYYLRVPPSGDATLEADEVWGILRGLESFSQLIFQSRNSYFLRTATVHDWPEYPLRGLMLDTSRHYLPKREILRELDLMAQNKLNLFHWHIVDSQAFPYVSKKYPHLSEKGAYSPNHVYSKSVVQEILDHAKMRGIRVMVEFDTPGHMGAWKGELGLLAECRDGQGHVIPSNIIDPSLDRNFAFLKNFFNEILSVFPDKFIHLGGDEVDAWLECWRSNPKIRDFMQQKMFGDNTTLLEDFYFDKLQDVITELVGADKDARMVFWEEVFRYNNPNPRAIAQIWSGLNSASWNQLLAQFTAAGHEVILSAGWYLNYISYGDDWKNSIDATYYVDPRGFNGTEEQKKKVLGGIACAWAEFIDATNLESRVWPRASAVAERLWSNPKDTTSADDAWPRLHEHSCRMISRGFRAQPINGPSFCPVEFGEL